MTSRGGSLAGSRVADRLSLLHLGEGAITLEKATAGVPADSSRSARAPVAVVPAAKAAKAAGGGPVCNAARLSSQLSLTLVDFFLGSKYHLTGTAVKVSSLQLKIFDGKKNLIKLLKR